MTSEVIKTEEPMRLCFVGDMNSIHVRKWVRFLCERGHEMYVISSHYYRQNTFHSARVFNLLPPPQPRPLRDLLARLGLRNTAKHLRAASHNLLLSFLPDERILARAQLAIEEHERQQLLHYLNLVEANKSRMAQLVREIKPDLLQSLRLYPEGFLASFCEFQPWVLMAWGQDISLWAERYPEVAALTRYAVPKCTMYFADNYRDIEDAHRYGLPADRPWHITPSGGGIETDKLQPDDNCRNSSTDKAVTFMTYRRVGGSFIDNRPVIRALAILRQGYNLDARFVIIGEKTGPYYDQVQIEAKRCGVAPYIEIRPPFPYSDLARVISEYELIVSAATHDGTTNALLETMWLGGIPLNSDLAPIREWITDGVNGYLFDLNNPEHIAQKFAQAMAERPKHDEFQRINRQIIKERADYQTCMSRVEEIYRELIAQSGKRSE